MEHLPLTTFRRCLPRYGGHHKVKRFTCLDQYLSMVFAIVTRAHCRPRFAFFFLQGKPGVIT
jgi:hypothetical protein